MGHYTEFRFKAKLKSDTPDEVISLLKRVIIDHDLGVDSALFHSDEVFVPDIDHEFFKCERWYMLLVSTNWGTIPGGKFYSENENSILQLLLPWTLDIHTEFKNYDDEIHKFMDWISPYVLGRKRKQYAGFYKTENYDREINLYVRRNSLDYSKNGS